MSQFTPAEQQLINQAQANVAQAQAQDPGGVPWIEDDPSSWSEVTIWPTGTVPYTFPCHMPVAAHDSNIQSFAANDRGGAVKTTRGRRPADIEFTILLLSDTDMAQYVAMMKVLPATKGKLQRVQVNYPSLHATGIKSSLYYKRGYAPHRSNNREPLTAKLIFVEDLPPQSTSTSSQDAAQKAATYNNVSGGQDQNGNQQAPFVITIDSGQPDQNASSGDFTANPAAGATQTPDYTPYQPPDPTTDPSANGWGPDNPLGGSSGGFADPGGG